MTPSRTSSSYLKNMMQALTLPPEITPFEEEYLGRMNRIAKWFYMANFTVFLLVGWFHDLAIHALVLTPLVLLGPWLAERALSNPRHVAMVHGFTAMCMGGVLVHLGQGPMQIEMHFYFFILLAMLAMFGNPMVILTAAATVTVHHLLVYLLVPSSVFNYEASIWVVLVHALFVVVESVAAVFLARSFFDNVIGLEKIVQERTSQLDRRNQDMRLVLDNVSQGFLTVAIDGSVSMERSAVVDVWFDGAEASFVSLLSSRDEGAGEWFEMGLESIQDGFLPLEMCIDQLPSRCAVGARTMRIDYTPILSHDGALEKLLVMISDITASLQQESLEQEQREFVTLFTKLQEDRLGFLEFFAEANSIMDWFALEHGPQDLGELKRRLHTIKGNAGIFGLYSISDACHALEATIEDRGSIPTDEEREALSQRWRQLRERLSVFAGDAQETVEIHDDEYQGLLQGVLEGQSREQLAGRIRSWKLEPAAQRLARLGEKAQALSKRLGKGEVEVRIQADDTYFEPERWKPFWSSFIHVLRNAVDHGLEGPEERIRVGKPEVGVIRLSANHTEKNFTLSIQDDGRGVDWERIEAKAQELGVELDARVDGLFIEGLSTRDEISRVSGRGVGMAAVLQECEALGGHIEVRSEQGHGTSFIFEFPVEGTDLIR